MVWALVALIFLTTVFADCTFPSFTLPPELAQGNTLVMDGYEWGVTETRNGNTVTRYIVRKYFEYPEEDAYITSEEANRIAALFFERNKGILGTPEILTVEAEEGILPVPVSFISTEKQHCGGLEVIGTVSGVLQVGGGDEYQVSSLTITWYSSAGVETLKPKVGEEEILKKNNGSKPELAILPTDDNFKLVWKVIEDNETKLIDAETGEQVSEDKGTKNTVLSKIMVIILTALSVTALGYFLLRKNKPTPKNKN